MAQSTKKEPKVPVALTQGKLMLRMLRLNSSWVSLISVIVLGTFIVSQDVQTYLDQRREIVEIEESIAQAEAAVEEMQAERDRWQDPVYIRSQARDRLYYVLPGEVRLRADVQAPAPTPSAPLRHAVLARRARSGCPPPPPSAPGS